MNLLASLGNSAWVRGMQQVRCNSSMCARWLTRAKLDAYPVGVMMEDVWYCSYCCFESAMEMRLKTMLTQGRASTHAAKNTLLGLTLLRQGLLTDHQYRELIAKDRSTDEDACDVAMRMDLLTEEEATIARAVHWSCPVFSADPHMPPATAFIPRTLIQRYALVPLHHAAMTSRLFIGFHRRVDYGALFAIEHMTGLGTNPCFLLPAHFEAIARQEEELERCEYLECHVGARSMAQRVCSLGASRDADHVSLVRCGELIWVRLRSACRSTDIFLETMSAPKLAIN